RTRFPRRAGSQTSSAAGAAPSYRASIATVTSRSSPWALSTTTRASGRSDTSSWTRRRRGTRSRTICRAIPPGRLQRRRRRGTGVGADARDDARSGARNADATPISSRSGAVGRAAVLRSAVAAAGRLDLWTRVAAALTVALHAEGGAVGEGAVVEAG